MVEEDKLAEIAEKIKDCRDCSLWQSATRSVPGEGGPEAEIMFIGEAPGYWEDQKGRPFVGRAGKLLDRLLAKINLKRSEVFIGNILKHRPLDNRDPLPEEVSACKRWLDEQIKAIKPKMIVALGRFAMSKFIPGGKISRIHGQPRWISWEGRKIILFPLFHPAAALRAGRVMKETEEDFQKIPEILENFAGMKKEAVIEKPPAEEKPPEEQMALL